MLSSDHRRWIQELVVSSCLMESIKSDFSLLVALCFKRCFRWCSGLEYFFASLMVALSRLRLAGAVHASRGRWEAGVGLRHPMIVWRALLMDMSNNFVWALRDHTGAQYSAVLYTRVKALERKVCGNVSQVVPASFDKSAHLDRTFWRKKSRCCLLVRERSKYLGFLQYEMVDFPRPILSRRLVSCVLRWKSVYDVFSRLK